MSGRVGDHADEPENIIFIRLVCLVSAPSVRTSAQTFAVPIVIRLLQAIGSSAIYPSGVGLIRDHSFKTRQSSALAVLSIFASAMTALATNTWRISIDNRRLAGYLFSESAFYFNQLLFSAYFLFPKEQKRESCV